MRGEVLKQENISGEALADCYQKAILLTMPEPEKIWKEKRKGKKRVHKFFVGVL